MASRRHTKIRAFQEIVCAVDFGPQSTTVLRVAAEVASEGGGRVSVLCVEDPLLGQGAAAAGYDTAALRRSTLAQLRRLARRAFAGRLPSDRWSTDVVIGQPARAIVEYARKAAADLVVMGTSSRRGPAKVFFGSTAEGVLRKAKTPVLVVPGGGKRTALRPLFAGGVLGAIELGAADRRDARRIAAVAAALRSPAMLLHVVAPLPGPPWLASRLAPHDRSRLDAAHVCLDAIARSLGVEGRVVLGHAAEEIPAVAVDRGAALIVLVLRRGHGFLGARQGTTTYRVLCGSKVPILALPPGN